MNQHSQELEVPTRSVGAELIAAERVRQILQELWTPEHDDAYEAGQLATAARCYLVHTSNPDLRSFAPATWPWHASWWKPSEDPIRNLTKAGALIAAEIDRLKRLEEKCNT